MPRRQLDAGDGGPAVDDRCRLAGQPSELDRCPLQQLAGGGERVVHAPQALTRQAVRSAGQLTELAVDGGGDRCQVARRGRRGVDDHRRIGERIGLGVRFRAGDLVEVLEADAAGTGDVEQGDVDAVLGRAALADHGREGGRHAGRRSRHEDRRGVDDVRVVTLAPPRQVGKPGQQQEREGRHHEPQDRVQLAGTVQPLGLGRGRRRLDGLEAAQDRPVEVAVARRGNEIVVDDPLQRILVEVGSAIAGSGEEAHLAVDEVVVQADHHDEPVVEARTTHAPLVHERAGVGEVLVLADERLHLGVDHELRPARLLDGVGDLLRPAHRRGLQGVRRVVHRLVRRRGGERRPRGAHDARKPEGEQREEREDGDDRAQTHRGRG